MPQAAAAAGGRMAREFEDRGTLWVGRPKRGEQLELGGHKGVSYHIAGLRPGASYEARLSYPAFNSAAFTVMFAPAAEGPQDDDGDDRAEGRSSGSSRSLLNVVQRRFTAPVTVTGPDGASVPVPELEDGIGFVMFVSAVREGVAAPGYVDDHIISYSIVVEELALPQYGGLPGGTLGVAAMSVGLIGFAAYGATKLRRILLIRARGTKIQ